MEYIKQNFETGQVLTADMLNHIEDGFDGAQDRLVSGYTIKTINGKSILGQGDLSIEGSASAISNLRNVYYGYDFTDVSSYDVVDWYYRPSSRENQTIGGITYDCPEAGASTYGYAIANTTALDSIRDKPINIIRFRLSPNETATSGVMNFAVMPVEGSTYTHYISESFTSADINNSWVTIRLSSPITIGAGETFVIQPKDENHTASSIKIACLRASAATTTDKYINIYNTVPVSWLNSGNYITRLGICVDLGYSTAASGSFTPNFDTSVFGGGWTNNNLTQYGYAPVNGYENSVVVNKYYVSDDIRTTAHVKLTALDSVLAFSSMVRSDGAGGKTVGSLIKFDFKNKRLIICKKTDGKEETSTYVSVDASSVITSDSLEYVLTVGRIDSRVFASLSDYKTGASIFKLVPDISTTDFSPVGRFYDYLTFSQISGSQSYWKDLYTYVPSNVNIAFIGDSITQGIYLPSVEASFTSILKSYYGNCASSGRGGAKVDFVIDAINDGLIAAYKPKYVSVTIGTNGDTTEAKLKTVVNKIKELGAIPILNCVAQTKDGKTTGDEQYISAVNNMILNQRVLSARFDIATGTDNNPGSPAPEAILQDEVHPNSTGHSLMAERFKFDLENLK